MSEGQIEGLQYVGFWMRVLASLIDTILILVIILPILIAIYGPAYMDMDPNAPMFHGFADLLLSYAFPTVAIIWFWSARQATPGKMAVGAKIVDARTGQPPSLGQNIGRYFGYFVSLIPLGLGLLWVAWDPRKQGFHDKIAGTVVVRSR